MIKKSIMFEEENHSFDKIKLSDFVIKSPGISNSSEIILKIKSNVETNSLESHLTRIRKKMNEIEITAKILTKNEKLLITS